MGRGGAGRAEKSARNAAQLSRSYSKLAYRLTSFRLGCVVDDVLFAVTGLVLFRYISYRARGTDARTV